MRTFAGASLVLFSLTLAGAADAGAISAVGAVKALDHVDQLRGVVGRADFDEGPTAGPVPRRVYADRGLSWQSGPLGAILPELLQRLGGEAAKVLESAMSGETP